MSPVQVCNWMHADQSPLFIRWFLLTINWITCMHLTFFFSSCNCVQHMVFFSFQLRLFAIDLLMAQTRQRILLLPPTIKAINKGFLKNLISTVFFPSAVTRGNFFLLTQFLQFHPQCYITLMFTYEPWVAPVIIGCEWKEVLIKSFDRVCLWKNGECAFHFGLIAFGHQRSSSPSVRSNPSEASSEIISSDSSHHTRNLLVRTENDYSYSQ